jgi:hypothetical protein
MYLVGDAAFVPHPQVVGAWMRVHSAVARVTCTHCSAAIGIPCRGKRDYTTGAHHPRREAAAKLPPMPKGMAITLHVEGAQP